MRTGERWNRDSRRLILSQHICYYSAGRTAYRASRAFRYYNKLSADIGASVDDVVAGLSSHFLTLSFQIKLKLRSDTVGLACSDHISEDVGIVEASNYRSQMFL